MKNKNINYKNQHKFSPAPFTLTSKLPTPPQRGSPLAMRAQRAEPALRAGSARARRRRRRRLASHRPCGAGVGGWGTILNYIIILTQKHIIRLVGKNIFLIFYFYLPKSKNIIYFCPYLFLSSNFG